VFSDILPDVSPSFYLYARGLGADSWRERNRPGENLAAAIFSNFDLRQFFSMAQTNLEFLGFNKR